MAAARGALALAAVFFLAPAAADAHEALDDLLKPGAYPGIVGLPDTKPFDKLPGPEKASRLRAFAQAAPADPEARRSDWQLFETILKGGRIDPAGERIREALFWLPPAEWYFLIAVDRERRRIVEDLGAGGVTNAIDNAAEFGNDVCAFVGAGKPLATRGYRCYDRRDRLARAVAEIQGRGLGRRWMPVALNANPGKSPAPFQSRKGAHHTNCLLYLEGGTRVEIVADAWEDDLVPAYTWWTFWEPDLHLALKSGGQERWCDTDLILTTRAAVEQERAKRHDQWSQGLNAVAPGLSP